MAMSKISFADYNDYRRQYKAASKKGDVELREALKAAWEAQNSLGSSIKGKLALVAQGKAIVAKFEEVGVDWLLEGGLSLSEARQHFDQSNEQAERATDPIVKLECGITSQLLAEYIEWITEVEGGTEV